MCGPMLDAVETCKHRVSTDNEHDDNVACLMLVWGAPGSPEIMPLPVYLFVNRSCHHCKVGIRCGVSP